MFKKKDSAPKDDLAMNEAWEQLNARDELLDEMLDAEVMQERNPVKAE